MKHTSTLGLLSGIGGLMKSDTAEELEEYQRDRERKEAISASIVEKLTSEGLTIKDATEVLYISLGIVQMAPTNALLSDFVDPGKEN